jgi:hypothetical protein
MPTTLFTARRAFGTMLGVIGGLAISAVLDWLTKAFRLDENPHYLIYALALEALCVLLAGAGAWFFQTWWSLLWVPAGFFAGCMVGAFIDLFLSVHALDIDSLGLGFAIFAFYLLPVVGVTFIFTGISRLVSKPGG